MAVCVALRWLCGLYRGVIQGSEKLMWLGFFNIIINSLRFVFVLPVMWQWGATPAVFFFYQVLIALLELIILWFKARCYLPSLLSGENIGWSFGAIKSIFRFSLILAFTSAIWTVVTQLDKFVLSNLLPLKEYGYFTTAINLMPRMVKLEAEGESDKLLLVYRQATQLVALIAGSLVVTLVFCAKPLLTAWLGNEEMASHIAPILKLYAIGNGVFALASFPYYLQYAKGTLRLHFYGHVLLLVILIPCIILGALHYGALGAGYAWITVNSLYFIIWVAVIHECLVPGLHRIWLWDILKNTLIFCTSGLIYFLFDFHADSRLGNLMITGCFGIVVFTLSSVTAIFLSKKF
jgi:O-antigen/teichoic acid export membrane protein